MRQLCAAAAFCIALAFSSRIDSQTPDKQASQRPPLADADKPRIFVMESNSWQMSGSAGGSNGGFAASSSGGASPQTAEIIKTFAQRCPDVVSNNRVDRAEYVVTLEHEGGKGVLRKKDKVAVFVRQTGDSIFSESTLSVGGSVQDACGAILDHWAAHGKELSAMPPPPPPTQTQVVVTTAPVAEKARLSLNSTPAGADIEINGSFVGNTPSILEVDPGQNEVKVTKKGYAPWTRTLTVKGGTITLNAELEAAP
jgi:hypothetical protein